MSSRASAGSRGANWVEILGRVLVAGLYLFAAYPKVLDPLDFARAVANYRLLPEPTIVPVALLLPTLEAVAGLSILLGRLYRGALLSILALSLVFAAAVLSAVLRGLDLACGCFGSGVASKADLGHIVLNLATALLCGWLLRRSRTEQPQPIWRLIAGSAASSRI